HVTGVQTCALPICDDLRFGPDPLGDLCRRSDRLRLDPATVVSAHKSKSAVAFVEVGLEDLNALTGQGGTSNAAQKLLGFSAEHHAADDFHPAVSTWVIHGVESKAAKLPSQRRPTDS